MPIIDNLLSVIAPHECIACGAEGQPLCGDCLAEAEIKPASCFHCGKYNPRGATCKSCQSQTKLAGVTVAKYYDGSVRELIKQLKYSHNLAAAKVFGGAMAPLLVASDFDVVAAIPAAPSRYRKRGYHQAELIACDVARRLGLPYRGLLGRLQVERQVGASRQERFHQVKDSFVTKRPELIKGQRVLLIDDVLTTGATLSEAAETLSKAGAKSVWAAVAAKH